MASVGAAVPIPTYQGTYRAFVVHAACPLHGDATLVGVTSSEATDMGSEWSAFHDGCTTRANYPRKRRI